MVAPRPDENATAVQIAYDPNSDAIIVETRWVGGVEYPPGGVRTGIGAEALLTVSHSVREILLHEVTRMARSRDVPPRAREAVTEAAIHYGRGLSDGLYLQARADASRLGKSGHTEIEQVERFPETSAAVLETLLAEVELCEDDLQRSRLAGIAERLKRFVPASALAQTSEVQSAS